jgi:hypothetical protein
LYSTLPLPGREGRELHRDGAGGSGCLLPGAGRRPAELEVEARDALRHHGRNRAEGYVAIDVEGQRQIAAGTDVDCAKVNGRNHFLHDSVIECIGDEDIAPLVHGQILRII